MSMKRSLFWAAFLACAVFLHFKNLGSTSLWQDEADTAVLARNTLRYGVPKVWDGRNYYSQEMGTDHDSRGIFNFKPWLDIYCAAGSFAVFGESTFAARLPFALCSLATLLFLYKTARRWSADKRVADLTIWLALLSVPYLLHARQCRYYALDAFFTLYLYYAYERLIKDPVDPPHSASSPRGQAYVEAWLPGLHLSASSLGLFHSNFLVFFAVLGGIAAHFFLFVPRKAQVLRRHAAAVGSAVLVLLPGCLYFHIFTRASGGNPHWLAARWRDFLVCLHDIDACVFPALLLPALPLGWKRLGKLKMPLTFLIGGLAFQMLAPRYNFRYLIPFIPLCSFLEAGIVLALFDRRKELGAAALALFLFSRAFCVSCWAGRERLAKTDLADFLYETLHPIREPVGAAADYLNRHASPGDLLLVSYPDLPFMFYTPLRVVGGRSGLRPVRPQDVRWIIVREDSEKADFPLDFSRYEKISLDAPNYPWGDRPDPDIHVFRTVKTPEPAAIYRRIGKD